MRIALTALLVLSTLALPAHAGAEPGVQLEVSDQYAKADQLRTLIKKKRDGLKKCFKAALKKDSSFHGKWELMATIAKTGATKVSKTTHVDGAWEFEACMLKVLDQLKFKPGHADTVPFALIFGS